jgi:TetR/AcrR family transcriptional regulator, transcriptional repressor for nem operon
MYENGAANPSFDDVPKAAKASGSQMSHYFADTTPAIGNLDSIAALRTWAQRVVEQQQNFEGGCRLGSLAADWWSQTPSYKRTSQPALSAGKPCCVEAC